MTEQSLRLPDGLAAILQARMAGRRPAALVHVCDWRDLAVFCRTNQLPVVFAEPLNDPAWDWRALHGLDVVVVGVRGVPDMVALKAVRPAYLRLIGPYGWSHLTGVQLCNS
jgi:hypothetical protein